MLSATKDDYGSELVPPLPLSFDRVNEGRHPVSLAPLFQLPLEVLSIIIHHVEPASLAALARVSRDCRQLARSRQFASIQLDYSDSSLDLLEKLMSESVERLENGGYTLYPSLGACIRRIRVGTHPGWVARRHGVSLDDRFMDLEQNERNSCLTKADHFFFENNLTWIRIVLSYRTTLPHLELIDWEDKITLSKDMFDGLSIRHSASETLPCFGRGGVRHRAAGGTCESRMAAAQPLPRAILEPTCREERTYLSFDRKHFITLCANTGIVVLVEQPDGTRIHSVRSERSHVSVTLSTLTLPEA